MGIGVSLTPQGTFIYRADLTNGLVEHELDHLFVGRFTGEPTPDRREADEWRWESWAELQANCAAAPEQYTAWLPFALNALGGSTRGWDVQISRPPTSP